MTLTRNGDVFVFDLGDGENRIDPEMLDRLEQVLTEVVAEDPPRALVTTSSGRHYSNGFDLDYARSLSAEGLEAFAARFERFLAAFLTAPVITVAAVGGHCYAAGALFALAHDYRIMRRDRGWFCLPSVDVGIPFTRAMTELIGSKMAPPIAHHLVVSADRIGGDECERRGVVDAAVDAERVLGDAVLLAGRLAGKDPATLGTIKERMYGRVTAHV